MKKRLLTGIKPTGNLTIGNYIGAISQCVAMQDDYESFIFIADLHSITIDNDPKELRENIRKTAGIYLASGLDPNKNTIFLQSENVYHANLSWILECNSYMGELSRMTQYKDHKAKAKNDSNLSCGIFTYPVLMASDIVIYDADVVPVGIDQKQHVELTRDLAIRFNNKYGNTFKVPEPVVLKEFAKIYDLQDPTKKMSKSDKIAKGAIMLLEDPESARKKIMSAVTDSEAIVKYDPDNKPGISNLMTIYKAFTNKDYKDIELEFKDKNYGEFKKAVAEAVVNFLTNLQTKYKEIINSDLIDKVLDNGKLVTEEITSKKLQEVKEKVGIVR